MSALLGDPATAVRLAEAGRSIRALSELGRLGFVSPQHEAHVRDLREHAGYTAAAMSAGAPAALAEVVEALEAAVDEAQRWVTEQLHEYGSTSFSGFFNLWEQSLDIVLRPMDRRCPYCDRLMSAMNGRHFVYGRVERRTDVCHRCGTVLDLPPEPYTRQIVLRCAETWRAGDTVDVDLVITPGGGPRPVTGWLAVHTSGGGPLGLTFPPPRRVALAGDAPLTVSLRVSLDAGTMPHQHFLRALLVAGGHVHYASRSVAVVR